MRIITIRLPDEIYELIRVEAFTRRTSINRLLLENITKSLKKKRKESKNESKDTG